MKFGENPRKVTNIVSANMSGFRDLYEPILRQHTLLRASTVPRDDPQQQPLLEQDVSSASRQLLLSRLPATVTRHVDPLLLTAYDASDGAARLRLQSDVRRAVAAVVGPASWGQSLKGIWTAGLAKTIEYALEKIRKMQMGQKQGGR